MKTEKGVIIDDGARILNSIEDGYLRADTKGKIISANRAIAQMCGYDSPEEMIGLPMKMLYVNPDERDQMIKALKEKKKIINIELELKCKNGSTFWSLNNIKNIFDEKGNLLGTEGVIRDITEIRHTKEKLDHTNKVLASIRNVNRLIATAKKVPELLQNICDILTSEKGYHNAWILLLNEKGKYEGVYHNGLGKEFMKIASDLKKNKFTACLAKTLEERNVVSITNPIEDCLDCPLSKYYHGRGAMIAPIVHNNKLYGLITVSIPRKYLIKEDIELLKELSDDIGLALHSIVLESKRVKAEKSLNASNLKLKATNQQLQASEEQLQAANQQLQAGKQQLQASNKQLSALNQQLQASEQQLQAANQQLSASEQQLRAANQQLKASEIELQNRNQLLRETGEIAKVGGWELDVASNKVAWSEETYRIHEVPIGQDPPLEQALNFFHPDDQPILQEALKNAVEKGEPYDLTLRFITAKGKRLITRTICRPETKDGKVIKLRGIFQDVTNQEKAEEERRMSNERFRIAQDMSPDGFTIFKPLRNAQNQIIDFIWVYENAAVAKINGTDPQKVVGQRFLKLFPGIKGTQFWNAYIQVADTGKAITFEDSYLGESMTEKSWLRIVVVPMEENIAILAQDITKRKIAEEDKREALERLNFAMETTNEGFWEWNLATNKISFDKIGLKMLGYEADFEPIDTQEWLDKIHPDHKNNILQTFDDYIAGKKSKYNVEYPIQKKDGSYIWVLSAARVFKYNPDGKPILVVGIHHDITDRIKQQQALKDAEEKYRALYVNAPLPYQSLSIDGVFNDVNPSWLSTLGYQRDEVIGKFFKDFLHPDWQPHFEKNFPAFKKRGYVNDVQFKIRHKKGHYLDISFEGCIGYNPDGSFKQTYCVFQDITERKQTEKALKESEASLRDAQRIANIGSWSIDLKTGKVEMSDQMLDIIGLTNKSEASDVSKHEKLYTPESWKKYNDAFNTIISKGKSVEIELEFSNKNAKCRYVISTGEPVFDDNNNVVAIEGTLQDITERKEAGEELNKLTKRLKISTESAQIGIWELDLKNNVLSWDNRMFELYGADKDGFGGAYEAWKKGVHPDDIERSDKEVQDAIAGKKEFHTEFRVVWPDGQIRHIEAHAIVSRDADGTPKSMIGVNWDITERKNFLKTLQERNEYIESVMENMPIGFALNSIDDGEVKYMNSQFEEIYGWSSEILTNTSIFFEKFFPDPEYRNEMMTKIVADMQSGNPERMNWKDLKISTSSGETRFVHAFNIPLLHQNLMISTVQDTTKRKLAEDELIMAKEKAEESDRLKSAFLSNMSHEIRTPMNGILGFTSLLKEPGLTGTEQQKFIDIIEKSGDRMLNTINDIIDISKIEAKQVGVIISNINLNEQMEELFEFFQPEAKKKNIQFAVTNRETNRQANVKSDKEKINSILTNLIKNAIKYTPAGSIEFGYSISKKGKQSELEFYVKDTGIGIAKERQNAVFNRFEQADIEDRQAYQGSGLGLAISKAYVELLNGKTWVESEEGVGSQFYFTIPYHPVESKTPEVNPGSDEQQVLKKKLKVLIVEDDEIALTHLSIVLKKYAKALLIAKTGIKAVEMFRDNPDIDIVLMDIKIPGIDGYEATRQIREFNKEVFILAQTAYAQSGDREKCIQAGCDAYIPKPIKKTELIELINKHLNK